MQCVYEKGRKIASAQDIIICKSRGISVESVSKASWSSGSERVNPRGS